MKIFINTGTTIFKVFCIWMIIKVNGFITITVSVQTEININFDKKKC